MTVQRFQHPHIPAHWRHRHPLPHPPRNQPNLSISNSSPDQHSKTLISIQCHNSRVFLLVLLPRCRSLSSIFQPLSHRRGSWASKLHWGEKSMLPSIEILNPIFFASVKQLFNITKNSSIKKRMYHRQCPR